MMIELPYDLHWRLLLLSISQSALALSGQYWAQCLNEVEHFVRQFIRDAADYNEYECDRYCEEWTWAVLTSSTTLSCAVGALLLELSVKRWGNRFSLIVVHNAAQIIAGVISYVGITYLSVPIFLLGRVLMGFAVVSSMIAPMYVAECSPDKHRGTLSGVVMVGAGAWAVITTISELPKLLGASDLWIYICIVPIIPALLHLVLTPFFPESPRYFYITKRDPDLARASACFYNGAEFDPTEMFADYDSEIERDNSEQGSVSLIQILTTSRLRRPFLLVVVINIGTAFGGIEVIGNYSTGLLMRLGLSSDIATPMTMFYTQGPAIVAVIIAAVIIDKVGRRVLLIWGLSLGALGMSCYMLIELLRDDYPFLTILVASIAICLSAFGYEFGPSLISLMIVSEICPQEIRPKTCTYGLSTFWMCSFIVALLYPPAEIEFGTLAVMPLVIVGILCIRYVYSNLPETRGKSIDAIVGDMNALSDENVSLLTKHTHD